MTNHSCIFLFLFVFATFAASCGGCAAVEKDEVFTRNLYERIKNVGGWVNKKEYSKIAELVDYMDEHIGSDPNFYITIAWTILIGNERRINDHVLPLWEHVYAKAVDMDATPYPYRLGQQIDILVSRLRIAKSREEEFLIVKDRKYMSGRMLSCWQRVLSYIDESSYKAQSDPYLMVNVPWAEFKSFQESGPYCWPPAKLIENKEVREKYQKEVNVAITKLKQANLHSAAKQVLSEKRNGTVVKDFLVAIYSLSPFATAELETLLTEHKVDETLAKEILDAVKKAEKDAPPPSDFRNWESFDALFKVTARFVALEGDHVLLERADGKQTNIEFSVLRMVDQKYVHHRLASKEAGKVPVLHTWRSAGGEYEIKAAFVSGDETIIFLKREDEAIIRVEAALLSAEDQEYTVSV